MTEPVDWRADGVPQSARFGDIYHSESGALAQARHVFLAGCGLPEAWAGHPQWRILETGFGLGLSFLTAWQAWRADPQRPRLLHFVSVEAHPVSRDDLLRAAAAYPELAPLAAELGAQWWGLLPGFHRLVFDEGRVLLTLCIGDVQAMLRTQQHFEADSIFLDGFSPERNPQMWSPETLKAVARFARRGTRIASWTIARTVRDALAQRGFQLRRAPGLPPKRDCLQGVFEPAWQIRRRAPLPAPIAAPGRCAVIGAGLAGAAVAASLARRGWQVTVLDAGDRPSAGASGLPVGVLAPHVSPDDALLSRLTRAGVRATWQQLEALLAEGRDWRACGVLERRAAGQDRLPADWTAEGPNESWHASAAQIRETGLPADAPALWHARGGWVRPARLVQAWLAQPAIELATGRRVARIEAPQPGLACWTLHDAQGALLAEAERVVIAAGFESRAFAPALALQPVRGQVAWGRMDDGTQLPRVPINGDGHLIAHVPDADGALWLTGATFDRDSSDAAPRGADTESNRERLARLHPDAALQLSSAFERGDAKAWAGVRCASGDRRPLVGPLDPASSQGVWLCTAMGSRGLTFAALCAELLAAQWHGEPLPLSASQARALDAQRSSAQMFASAR
ncbi:MULTISPECIES: FAD-dependent 5-carboxymethylaminomethyl-2-thiouridine(34) oxidoreductase MnmC [unclassified Variovorax]|uniref:FAD-dependent 5-carboxymethylaminomethyl-2-thiouridine(34) oxidoreductase MnmC n=1 Tax=unclassified Variovorax TaxID=663243 RepID=UPI00088C4EC1|nr:FAD-dependent 5-carboxymethylaminomethyl-2-thiouridine(34) oxidoreductase MnmC [Variovorax sp. CF079]SDD84033.1 tRNA 5-methylaminomethyl-2-thiouridine biosynthesis bifunctional protein [Variovorax sp. CF079]